MKTVLGTLILALLTTFGASAAEPTRGVDLKLISEVRAIQPGTPFTVALHIHHHDGYHTYSSDGQVSSDQPQKLNKRSANSFLLTLHRAEFGPSSQSSLPGVLTTKNLRGTINPFFPDKKTTPKP